MAEQNCVSSSKYWKWSHLDGMTRVTLVWSGGLLYSELKILKWFFSCLDGGIIWLRKKYEVCNFSTTYWMIYRPDMRWQLGPDSFITTTSKGLFKWRPPPDGESKNEKYLRGTVKPIFPLMCLAGRWKILSTFFLHILF